MYRVFGFLFSKPKSAVLFLLFTVVFVLGYHRVLQKAIRNHPQATTQAVQDHCRYVVGKRVGNTPPQELDDDLQRCKELRVRSVDVAGGVFDPVIVKITVEAMPSSPKNSHVLIFKTADISSGHFDFISGLHSLTSGQWKFNFFNTYSETTFQGSF